ncbi:hypothetical protein OIU84_003069 [Salix udensis]|uniref:Uncharacterized protein n=1 Tax=Salix udensis TaxID=889485 RepID=A0AAD6P606_9ROSI|nr:hypothetical protein OIU84_003069 [Salix udensis]
MAKCKAKKKPHTTSSHSPPRPPPNKKDVQPPLPVSLPPPLALDLHTTVKAISNKYGILGSVLVGPFGAGNPNFQHQHTPASTTAVVVPPKILLSDKESEVEESSSCDSDAYSSNSSDLGPVDVPISSSPVTTATIHKSKKNKRGQSATRKEQASADVLAEGAALNSQPSLDDAVEIVNRVDFASSSSDTMIVEAAAAVGEWEIVNKKKHNSRNMKQAAAKGVGVGSAIPPDSGMVSR